MLIQPLTRADIPEICRIGQSEPAFAVAEGAAFWTAAQLESWIDTGNDVLLVTKQESKIVGFALSTLHSPTGRATWENLWVDPAVRKSGVGAALTKELLRQLKERG